MRSPRLALVHRQSARSYAAQVNAIAPSQQALLARDNFDAFRWFVKKHKTYEHHNLWGQCLNTGQDSRCLHSIAGPDLLILAPRGSSKSTYLIEWVAWQIGRHAAPAIAMALKVLYVSYELKTARQKSQQIKRLLSLPEYRKVFPWIKPGENWANELWEIDSAHAGLPVADEPYTVAAAGLIGNVTGKRCFPGDILIETEIGSIPISEACEYITLKILTFNENTRQLEWRKLKNSASRFSNELVEVRTSGGGYLRCTPDHLVYTANRGYTEALHLLPGDTVVVAPQGEKEVSLLPRLQQGANQYISQNLQRLLSICKKVTFSSMLQELQLLVCDECVRTAKESHAGDTGFFLQSSLSRFLHAKAESLPRVRGANCKKPENEARFSLRCVPGAIAQKSKRSSSCNLSNLSNSVFSTGSPAQVLFSPLRQQGSFSQDDWGGQQSLQGRGQLQQAVYGLEGSCSFQGQPSVHGLSNARKDRSQGQVGKAVKHGCSSLQSQPHGQSTGEFGDSLSELSHHSSQVGRCWKTDAVSSVVRLPSNSELVYDLEIEGNHNFFANGILVHNCHLAVFDDLIKSPEAIANPDIRNQMVSNHRNIIKPTRFDGARSICLGTRMRPDDIYVTEFNQENDWQVVEQSAILELPGGGERSYWEPEDEHSPGQTLVFLQDIREKEPETFSYQYQNKVIRIATQAITPELIVKGLIPPSMDYMALGVDLSAGQKETNDYTTFVLGGMARDDRRRNKYYVIDCWEGRVMGNMKKLEAIAELYNCWKHLCPYLEIFVESNGYQLSFAGDYQDFVAQNEYYDWRVTMVPSRTGKLERLRGVSGLLENKLVTFNQYGRLMGKLSLQLTNWGSTAHDDLADGFEKCLSGLRQRSPLSSVSYVS
jgi:phage terminase large subunit-like protein